MLSIPDLLIQSLENVWITFTHNWLFLLVSILISVGLKRYLKAEKVSALLTRYRRVGVVGATVAAVTTPLCSGGTTAVILGMMTSTIPWAPIVAFMVASPLTSPEELVYSAGLFGWPFAIAFFVSSILLGLLGGILAEFFESRGWLANQARFVMQPSTPCNAALDIQKPAEADEDQGYSGAARLPVSETNLVCGIQANQPAPVAVRRWIEEIYRTSKQLLGMFLVFSFIGYVLNGLIPPAWVAAIFGKGNAYSVPLAATLGLPLYINTEGSLPLVRALLDGGMSQGAALAFLITGAGTSFGAVAGALTIARWRVLALVVGTLWIGAVTLGVAYDLLLAAHLF